jgi:anti-sigma-K factor RskA
MGLVWEKVAMQITDAQFEDLLPLYVLGSLETDELEAMEAYLSGHPEMHAEVAEARQVAALLAWTPPQHDPPPALRERVLRQAQQDVRQQGARVTQPLSTPSWWERIGAVLRPPVARAGLLVSAALLAVMLVLSTRTWQLQQEVQQQQALIEQQQALVEMFRSPDMQVASLTAPDVSTEARVQIAFDPEGRLAVVVASNLPQLPASQTYQFWLISDQPASGGVFQVNERGEGSLVVNADQPLGQYQSVGVSREPAGGSATPTSDQIVLLEDLPRPE